MKNKGFFGQKWLLMIYMICMIVLLYMRDVSGMDISKYIFLLIMIVVSLISNYQILLSLILFSLPLLHGLPGNYILPVWVMLILRYQIREHTLNPWAIVFSSLFVLWDFIICVFYPYEIPFVNMIGYFSSLLILTLIIAENNEKVDYDLPVTLFCVGCCVFLSIISIKYLSDPSSMITEGGARMGGSLDEEAGKMTLKANPNVVGFLSVASIACSLVLFYYKKINIILLLPILSIAFVGGLYSVSRTWTVLTALLFVSYFVLQKRGRWFGYVVIGAFVFLAIYLLSENKALIEVFVERFTDDTVRTGGDRTTLFTAYNDFLLSHPINWLFGASTQIYKEVTGIYNSTHNSLQQIWLSYGVLGFLIFMFPYFKMLKKFHVKGEYMAWLPMGMVFLFLQTIQLLNPHSDMYPLIAAFLIMKIVKFDYSNGKIT